MGEPYIEKRDGQLAVNVSLGLEILSQHPIDSCFDLVSKCRELYKNYKRGMYIVKTNPSYKQANCTDVMELCSLNVRKGTNIEIRVDKTDKKSRELALKLYEILS